jgi:hypothetical protein
MSIIRNLIGVTGRAERRGGTRIPTLEVDAYYSFGSALRRAPVNNISPTGIYLSTTDQLPSGMTVVLTMKGRGHSEEHPEPCVRIPAKVVRHDCDGVGMEFVLESISTAQWLDLFSKATSLISKNDPIRVFRFAKAFAFLQKVAPSAGDEILSGITRAMSLERIERAIEMIFNAETLLSAQITVSMVDAPPPLIRQILEEGSRDKDEQTQRYWAGMLASTCLDSPDSTANAAFITLLSELAPIHIRILDAAGWRGIQAGWQPGAILCESVYCTTKEIKEITNVESLSEIDAALDFLDHLGLLEMTVKFFGQERINLTPTLLGLKFYARCSGLPSQLDPVTTEIQIAS